MGIQKWNYNDEEHRMQSPEDPAGCDVCRWCKQSVTMSGVTPHYQSLFRISSGQVAIGLQERMTAVQ